MATTDTPSAIMIALRFFGTGGSDFGPGDRFDRAQFHTMSDRRIMQMTESRFIGPLTADSYAKAVRIRGDGYIGKGFTREGLISMGILDKGATKAQAKAEAPPSPPSPPAKDTPPAAIPAADYAVIELYNGYWLAGAKRGVATRFDIFDGEGNRLNPGKTENGIKKAREEADRMRAVADAEAAASRQNDEPEIVTRIEGLVGGLVSWTGPATVAAGEESKENAVAWADDAGSVFVDGKFVSSTESSPVDDMTDEELFSILEDHGISVAPTDDRTVMLSMVKMLDLSTGADASDTSGAEQQKEGDNGGDVQSSSDGAEGPGSPEDR